MYKLKITTICIALTSFVGLASANDGAESFNFLDPNKNQEIDLGFIKTNLDYSSKISDRQEYLTDKSLQILKAKQSGELKDESLYIGGRVTASHVWEKTNIAGKFPIISRIPNQHTSGEKADEEILNDASVNLTANYGAFTAFVQGEYSDVEYPGQENAQLRKFYLMYGDLGTSPFYALFGRKTVSFGNFSSYAPITHNHSSHYFWAQTDKPLFEFGYYENDLNLVATLLANDRGLRVVNAPDNSGYENFAFSFTKKLNFSDDLSLKFGGGYLKGTIYDGTLAHHPPSAGNSGRDWNGAWNINAELAWQNIDFMAEYSRSIKEWQATDWEVSALTLQTRYKTSIYNMPYIFSVMYSRGEQGDDGTEWERMEQTIVGGELKISPNVELGFEYLYNKGFVPLILPQITGDRDVESHTGIASIQFSF